MSVPFKVQYLHVQLIPIILIKAHVTTVLTAYHSVEIVASQPQQIPQHVSVVYQDSNTQPRRLSVVI